MPLALDSETGLIANGLLAPPPVCLSYASDSARGLVTSRDDWAHMRAFLQWALRQPLVVGFNFAFDAAVWAEWLGADILELVFRAYAESRVHDIQIVERLGQIAHGEETRWDSLADCVRRYRLPEIDKTDGTRTGYGPLLFCDESHYTPRQREYSVSDAVAHLEVYRRSRARYRDVPDEAIAQETTHAFWLHLIECWGLRTSPDRVADLRRAALARQAELHAIARREGLIQPNGKKSTQRLQQVVARAYGVPGSWVAGPLRGLVGSAVGVKTRGPVWSVTPGVVYRERAHTPVKWTVDRDAVPDKLKTKNGGLATGKVAKADSDDPVLQSLTELGAVDSVVNMSLPMLETGVDRPIHTRFRLANTTRTTSSADDDTDGGGNAQNAARNLRDLPEYRVRDAYEPRPGHCYGSVDVTGLEHGTFAQVLAWCCGRYSLAQKLNAGVDLHLEYAAKNLLCIPYADALAHKESKAFHHYHETDRNDDGTPKVVTVGGWIGEARQFAKIPGFGKLGGQGWRSLIKYARQQGIHLTPERAQELDRTWLADNPDAVYYQRQYIPTLLRVCPHHGRPRRAVKGCATCGRYDFLIPGSPGIWRRNVTFTSACNGHFQALGAQVMKRIGWAVTCEAWLNPASPLHVSHGGRLCNFVHDSIDAEIPIGLTHEYLTRLGDVMVAGLAHGLPDLRMGVDPMATMVQTKRAKLTRDKEGRIIPWQPS